MVARGFRTQRLAVAAGCGPWQTAGCTGTRERAGNEALMIRASCADVPDSLRSDRRRPLRQGRRPERPGPPALQRVGRHLLQGQRRRRLRRLGARPQPLGLFLQPLVNYWPLATSLELLSAVTVKR